MIIIEDLPLEERLQFLAEQEKKAEAKKRAQEKKEAHQGVKRYRCEQINIIKLNGVISAHSSIKTEYLVEFIDLDHAVVTLTDSIYNFHTQGTEELVAFISSSDQVKNLMKFKLDDNGKIKEITNGYDLFKKWEEFKSKLNQNPYVKKLDSKAKQNIINMGDQEFSANSKILFKNAYANLFNQIIFGQYLKHDFEHFQGEIIKTQSSFFPDMQFDVNCETKVQTQDENNITYLNKGKPLYVNIEDMIMRYDKLYREQLQYKFTDYKYELEMNYTVSKKENRIIEANASITEAVKNNMESQVLYNLKQVEL